MKFDASALGPTDVSAITGAESSANGKFYRPCLGGEKMCQALQQLRTNMEDKPAASDQAAGATRDSQSMCLCTLDFGAWLLDTGCGHESLDRRS